MKKVAFHTLGCKLNFAETSSIGRLFEARGFQKVSLQDQPDILVINTCSVTNNADKKCHKLVREALGIAPNIFIVIVGCYAQLKPQEIVQIPGVDAVLGASEKFQLLDLITNFDKRAAPEVYVQPIKAAKAFAPSYSMGDRTRTFLKVQDGCNYHCSFCTIPLARGKSRSTSIESVVQQAREIAQKDIKEIVLTGINLGDYGIIDNRRKTNFLSLIQVLDEVTDIKRFRISSIEPNLLSEDIITFVAQSQRFMPHFHIPLQSGSNKILKRMRRRYQRELYEDRIAAILAQLPQCCIGVDVIVGFPGETEEDFLATYHFLNELPIAYLHVFPYSERDNTAAIQLSDVVPLQERSRRAKMLRILSEKKLRYFYEAHLNNIATVLFEQEENEGTMQGFTENYIRVIAPYEAQRVNTLQPVQLKNINNTGLMEVTYRANKPVLSTEAAYTQLARTECRVVY
ncbi:MAG: tRNA (N(6)-L-threonylcarbamoyladenosine(37)-C(2))-methylthiotransferase MtaB [Bacteroidota bacterium]